MTLGMTVAEILDLPAVVDLPTAARALGIGRTTAYQLARDGEFPCHVLRFGATYRIPTSELRRLLLIDIHPTPASDQVDPETAQPTADTPPIRTFIA